MTYSIKEAAQRSNLSIYTLRFYDKQGLLPFVARNKAGYREFTEGDLQLLHTVCCLKNTGMKIKDIRRYIAYVMQGPKTVDERRALLQEHRTAVLEKQQEIQRNLAEIDFKLSLYSASDAEDLVRQEIAAAVAEKKQNQLPNPFPA
ncbi:MerR family transcriptional regulator [Pediococcus siamensis]|uniref:MerR family transcriptional regulator n=1 Tax=Pediococcus siamensis TaxID=381829 RepID=UPI0039A06DA1